MRSALILVVSWSIAACGGGDESARPPANAKQSLVREPAPAPADPAPPKTAGGCQPLKPGGDELYRRAQAFEISGDEYSKERQEGLRERRELYAEAARRGHLEAQYQAGMATFSALYQASAPTPEQREAYVEALTFLFIAGSRDPGRDGGLKIGALAAAGELPARLEEPLASVPRAWMEASLAAAREWMRCYGSTVPSK